MDILSCPCSKIIQKISSGILSHSHKHAGNKGLCGTPLNACANNKSAAGEAEAAAPASNKSPASQHKSTPSNTTIIVLAVLLALLILLLIIVFILVRRRKQEAKPEELATSAARDGSVTEETNGAPAPKPRSTCTKKRSETGKLEFVRDDKKTFDLQDLLTASAEVLESGNFESSYKVEIFAGQMLVVKRFRQMSKVGREDFHEHIRRMGKLKHPNVLGLVAYYYRREEKLLIFDFVDNGHLASHLYGM